MEYANLVRDTVVSSGSNTFVLSGSPAIGNRAISALGVIGTKFPYFASQGALSESGDATIIALNTVLRNPIDSSNGGALVNFSTGADFICSPSADVLRRGLVDQTDIGFDIILCAGQSNMVGLGAIDTLVDVHDPRVFQFGGWPSDSTYRKIVSGADPLKFTTENSQLGPSSWFAKTYAGIVPGNRKVLLVPVGQGGTYLVAQSAEWAPGTPGGIYYETAINQTNLALTNAKLLYPKSRVVGVLWRQGESDGDWTVSQTAYVTALKSLIAGFRSRITGASESWFIIAGMIPEAIANRGSGYPPINAAHIQVANETRHCAFVPAVSGHQNGDNLHADGLGNRIMGCSMATSVYDASTYGGVDNIPPTTVTAIVANGSPYTLTLACSEGLNPSYVPDTSAYTIGGHAISAVSVSGSSVIFTSSVAFVYGESTKYISYVKPATNALRDTAGNLMESFTNLVITNNVQAVDIVAPTFVSAEVPNAAPNTVRVTFSETLLASSVPNVSVFNVGRTIDSVSFSDNIAILTVSSAYVSSDSVLLSYVKPSSGNVLKDAANNQTVSFGPVAVTNNVSAQASLAITRLVTLANFVESGTAPNNTYSGTASYNGSPLGGQPAQTMSGDGTFEIDIVGSASGKPMISLNTTSGVKSYASMTYQSFADISGYGSIGAIAGTAGAQVVPAANDKMRLRVVRPNIFAEFSRDNRATWTVTRSWSGVGAGVLYLQVATESSSVVSVPSCSGVA